MSDIRTDHDFAQLGFGLMRLPQLEEGGNDIEETKKLVDAFMDAGFTYFDTAPTYHGGTSEIAAKEALVDRYPRESFQLATKMPAWAAKSLEEAQAFFDRSLERTGAGYFDYYLLHQLTDEFAPLFEDYDLWNFAYTYNCISDHSAYAGLALLLACTIPTFFIKKGAWLQHRAQTLGLWIMFVMTVPQFADVLAPIPTTHNPTAFFAVSFLALASNAALAIYQFRKIRKLKLNPLKDQIYADTKSYQELEEANR